MNLFLVSLIFVIGIIAGFIGTIVGAGGLVSLPALIFIGLSPQAAIATNKLGGLGLFLMGLIRFHQVKKVNYKVGIPGTVIALIGAYFGANTLLAIPNSILEKITGIIILIILGMVIVNKNIGIKKSQPKNQGKIILGYGLFLLIGFWGAIFGPGFAAMAIYVLTGVFGLTFLQSAGTVKPVGIGISLVAVIIFIKNGLIYWNYGIPLVIGMMLGSYVGVSYGIKKGNLWVKRLFTIVVGVSAIKLLI